MIKEFFNANGSFGYTAAARPEFPSASDLLLHMDRLGIHRSLVYHLQARDQNADEGNEALLKEIEACPGAKARLLPAFTVVPTMVYASGSMDNLVKAMAMSKVQALRAFPAAQHFRLWHLEPILEGVSRFNPVLLVNIREVGDARDVLQVADSFPRMPIILTEGMWPHMLTLFDLMRRRKNIMAETSWIHSWETIEDLVHHFGAERIIFGVGPKAHQGASLGELAHAKLPDGQREQIAHGNLEGLLGLTPFEGPISFSPTETLMPCSGLWGKHLAGGPTGVGILDAHAHLGGSSTWVRKQNDIDAQIRETITEMDRLGIQTLIVSGQEALFSDPVAGNRLLEEHAGRHGDRFKGYLGFNPFYDGEMAPLFDDFFSRPFFVGFKVLSDYWRVPMNDPRFVPVWKYAHDHRLPILLHTWDTAYSSPILLKDVVKRYPEAIFLLGHSGGGDAGRLEATEMASANPNVYLEWCGSFCCSITWEETLSRVSEQKVVFGTDGPYHSFAWELGRFLSLNITEGKMLPILGQNMRHILARRV